MSLRVFTAVVVAVVAVPTIAYASSPFTDVPPGAFFEDAVEWAFENEITTGKTPSTFDPHAPTTRGEVVTFLERYHSGVAVGLNTDTLAELSCTTGQIPKFTAGSWTCGDDTDTTIADTDTLADLSCATDEVARWNGAAWGCAEVDVVVNGFLGSTERTLASAGGQGLYPSVAYGTDGNPIISHTASAGFIYVYFCSSLDCSTGTGGGVATFGEDTAVAVRANGNAMVAYYDDTNGNLRLVDCTANCGSGTDRALDSSTDVGTHASITIGTDGYPIISYYDVDNGDLKVYACAAANCSSGTATTLDSTDDVGQWTSIAIGDDNNPIISYHDVTNGDLKVYACTATDCSTGSSRALASSDTTGTHTSIAIGDDGNPVISHRSITLESLELYVCGASDCSTGINRTLAAGGIDSSIAIAGDDNPIVSHHDGTDLKVHDCATPSCSAGRDTVVTSTTGGVGWAAIASNSSGDTIISYHDQDAVSLDVAILDFGTAIIFE